MTILKHPHPALRQKAKPVEHVDADLRTTIRWMFDLMQETGGVGLAAPQVGIPQRFFIIHVGAPQVFINPVLSRPRGSVEMEEGCLSLPGQTGLVRRPKSVTVDAWNETGVRFSIRAFGELARVVQHENDHLDGVLFIDKMKELVASF